jgi:hypothetical protein
VQLTLERQTLESRGAHARRVGLVVVPAALLGPVHGGVGVPEDRLHGGTVLGMKGDPHARGDEHGVVGQGERLAERAQKLLGDHDGVGELTDLRQEHPELVGPESGHGVLGPDGSLEARGHLEEQLVAHLGAQAVVHLLEVIQVEHQHADAALPSLTPSQGLTDPVSEQHVVGEPRELVDEGPATQLAEEAGVLQRRRRLVRKARQALHHVRLAAKAPAALGGDGDHHAEHGLVGHYRHHSAFR